MNINLRSLNLREDIFQMRYNSSNSMLKNDSRKPNFVKGKPQGFGKLQSIDTMQRMIDVDMRKTLRDQNSQLISMQPDKLKKILDWKIDDTNGGFFGDRKGQIDPLLLNNMKNTIGDASIERDNKGRGKNARVSKRY